MEPFANLIGRIRQWWSDHWRIPWFRIIVIMVLAAVAWAVVLAVSPAGHLTASPQPTATHSTAGDASRKTDGKDTAGKDATDDDPQAVAALRQKARQASQDMQDLLATKSGDETIALLIRDDYSKTQVDGSNPLNDTETTLTNLIKTHSQDDGITTAAQADAASRKIDDAYEAWQEQVWTFGAQEVNILAIQYANMAKAELFSSTATDDQLSEQCLTLKNDLDAPTPTGDAKEAFGLYSKWRARLPGEYKSCKTNLSQAMLDAAPPSNGQPQVNEDFQADGKQ